MNNEQRILLVEELYHQYYPRLEQYCRRYVGYNHAFDPLIEDCIQEVFLELDKEIEILQQHPALEGWIMTTCKHRLMTSLDKLRRRNKFVAFSIDDSYSSPYFWFGNRKPCRSMPQFMPQLRLILVYSGFSPFTKVFVR